MFTVVASTRFKHILWPSRRNNRFSNFFPTLDEPGQSASNNCWADDWWSCMRGYYCKCYNLFATGKGPASTAEELNFFTTSLEVEAMLMREMRKPLYHWSSRMKPPYATWVTKKPYLVGYATPQFQKFDLGRGNTSEHVIGFLDTIGVLMMSIMHDWSL